LNNRDGRALGKCPVDIYSEGARWRAGKMIKPLYCYSIAVFLIKKLDVTFASHKLKCYVCVTFRKIIMNPEQFIIIPILGILAGIIIPISVFIWQYYDQKRKREAIIEIVKHLNNPSKLEELLTIFDERKKEPIDYRRSGVISIFIGVGLFIFGYYLTPILKGVGALVGLIGVGTMIAGYLYPNTEKELTDAVNKFEKK